MSTPSSDPVDPPAEGTTTRRQVLQTLGLAAAGAVLRAGLAATPGDAAVPGDADVIVRRMPRTGEPVPVVGLGTFLTFDLIPGAPRAHVREVLRRFHAAGGRVVDTSPLYGSAEASVGDAATALGIGDALFITNKLWTTGEYLADDSHAERSLRTSQERLWRTRIDVMQCHSLVNVDVVVPLLRRWKAEGRVRHVGVTHHDPAYFDALAAWIARDAVDAVQVRYSIFSRDAERRVLPLAAERGVAVLVNMPLEKGRLHQLVAGRPLPAFARELGIESWAEYFLKWVVAHSAVTCVLPATSDPAHVAENMRALRGALPDAPMRERMWRHVSALPGFAALDARGAASWYPGKRYPGLVARAQEALQQSPSPREAAPPVVPTPAPRSP